MEPLRRICAASTVFLRLEAIALGYDDRALARGVRRGVLHRVRRGAYMFAEDWAALDAHGRHLALTAAVLRTAGAEMVLSHVTAVAAHGLPLWDLPLDEVHVTRLDRRAGRREAGVAQHSGELTPEDVVIIQGVPVTSPARTAIDLTTIADIERSLCVLDAMLRQGHTTQAALQAAARQAIRRPRSLATDLAVRLADGCSESVGETRCRYMFWRGGLPMPELQHVVRDSLGVVVARLDFAWPELGLFVEFDGRVKYQELLAEGESVTDVVLREKRREELICRLTGWRCLRLTWADLYRPAATCALIRQLLSTTTA